NTACRRWYLSSPPAATRRTPRPPTPQPADAPPTPHQEALPVPPLREGPDCIRYAPTLPLGFDEPRRPPPRSPRRGADHQQPGLCFRLAPGDHPPPLRRRGGGRLDASARCLHCLDLPPCGWSAPPPEASPISFPIMSPAETTGPRF